ncbi:MAG: enoyl-CoA hydratase/isomerase family protein [Actinomycetia bacterium]|nr:enoyl-CoA hydratase/isomerase family protein [Actinomycetes bacterium]MCP5031999.1 enoyl-CoA hydratase/isomerase family protein [Actinomycetes bacterium]
MDQPISVERHERDQGTVVVLTMTDGENRWNTTFTRAFDAALDEVEATEGAATLVTASANDKFFSNGLDLEWVTSRGEHRGGDRKVFGTEVMALFGRLITFPLPTVCAINGHCFGAGLMIALCHDVRVMRQDRGFLCANELELGFAIPEPELALFNHKLSPEAFHQTVVLAKRWSGSEAEGVGMVQRTEPLEKVLPTAMEVAEDLLRVARNREITAWTKEHLYGENAILNRPHGPAYLLNHSDQYASGPGDIPSSP